LRDRVGCGAGAGARTPAPDKPRLYLGWHASKHARSTAVREYHDSNLPGVGCNNAASDEEETKRNETKQVAKFKTKFKAKFTNDRLGKLLLLLLLLLQPKEVKKDS
jgi:hypothetical protein